MRREGVPISRLQFFGAALVGGLVCYWGVIAWVSFYTKLPQSLSGGPADWGLWSGLVLIIAIVAAFAGPFIYRWALPESTEEGHNREITTPVLG